MLSLKIIIKVYKIILKLIIWNINKYLKQLCDYN